MRLNFWHILILSLLQSCSKREELPSYYVSNEVRSYAEFHLGTYWIYMDDSTGIEDSMWVTYLHSSWDTKYDSKGNAIGKDERIECSAKVNSTPILSAFEATNDVVGYRLYDWSFGLPLNPNDPYFGISVFKIDSLIVDSTTYNELYNVNAFLADQNYSYTHLNVYVKSKIGVLKWNILYRDGHTQSKSLVRYNIIQ